MRVYAMFFSGTGTTETVVTTLAAELAGRRPGRAGADNF